MLDIDDEQLHLQLNEQATVQENPDADLGPLLDVVNLPTFAQKQRELPCAVLCASACTTCCVHAFFAVTTF